MITTITNIEAKIFIAIIISSPKRDIILQNNVFVFKFPLSAEFNKLSVCKSGKASFVNSFASLINAEIFRVSFCDSITSLSTANTFVEKKIKKKK